MTTVHENLSSENDLLNRLQEFAQKASELQAFCHSEEQTKLSLINPYLETIGFDVRDPRQVRVEFQAGVGKATERVDYAILEGIEPVILIEAKPVNTHLDQKLSQQLRRYMIDLNVHYGVITNGVKYHWFGRRPDHSVNDEPFLIHDVTKPSKLELGWLHGLSCEQTFKNEAKIMMESHMMQRKFRSWLLEIGSNPSDRLLRQVLQDSGYSATASLIDRARPILKEVWNDFIKQRSQEDDDDNESEGETLLESEPTEHKTTQTRSTKCWYELKGGERVLVNNATQLMLELLDWAAHQHKEGVEAYFDSVKSRRFRRHYLVIKNSDFVEELHSQYYSRKFTNSGWAVFRNVSNLGKLEIISKILESCRLHNGLSPKLGDDLKVYMPSVPSLADNE